ncbi:hypothetical protein BX666DRAFT_2006734 [Dichotomocladium elegans]|nr:hypothetical protein BX666DRAFT_2006734 [Dichotomocladium elegans]
MAPIPNSTITTGTDAQAPSATSFPLDECLAYTRYIPIVIIVVSALYGLVFCFKGVQMQLHRLEKSRWSGTESRDLNAIPMGFRKPRQHSLYAPPPSLVAPNEEDEHLDHEQQRLYHQHERRPSTSTTVWVDESPRQKTSFASWMKRLYEKRMRQRQWSVSSGFGEYPHGRHMQDLVDQRLQQLNEEEQQRRDVAVNNNSSSSSHSG